MVVGVFEADLHRIVVHVADGQVVLDALKSHRLELQIGHGAGGVLRERLVDADCQFRIHGGIARHQMRGDQFAGHGLRRFTIAFH